MCREEPWVWDKARILCKAKDIGGRRNREIIK